MTNSDQAVVSTRLSRESCAAFETLRQTMTMETGKEVTRSGLGRYLIDQGLFATGALTEPAQLVHRRHRVSAKTKLETLKQQVADLTATALPLNTEN